MTFSTYSFLTDEQRDLLVANSLMAQAQPDFDPLPVVKLFMPDGGGTWLLTELNAEDHTLAMGLCDLGVGLPELGYVSLAELASLRGLLGLPVERDLHFRADKRLSVYAREARAAGRIMA